MMDLKARVLIVDDDGDFREATDLILSEAGYETSQAPNGTEAMEKLQSERIDLILRAFAKVIKRHPDVRLCIVGDGPLANELKCLATNLEISGAVDFIGHTNNVQPYLANFLLQLI